MRSLELEAGLLLVAGRAIASEQHQVRHTINDEVRVIEILLTKTETTSEVLDDLRREFALESIASFSGRALSNIRCDISVTKSEMIDDR